MKTSYILIGLAIIVVLYFTMSKTTLKTTGSQSGVAGILSSGAKLIGAGTTAYTAIADSSTDDN